MQTFKGNGSNVINAGLTFYAQQMLGEIEDVQVSEAPDFCDVVHVIRTADGRKFYAEVVRTVEKVYTTITFMALRDRKGARINTTLWTDDEVADALEQFDASGQVAEVEASNQGSKTPSSASLN